VKDRPHNVHGTVTREASVMERGSPRVPLEVDSCRGNGEMEVGCTVGTDVGGIGISCMRGCVREVLSGRTLRL